MAAIVGLVVGNATYAVIGRDDCEYTIIIPQSADFWAHHWVGK